MAMSITIAEKIKEIRRKLDLTQLEIAKLAGTSNSYVAHLEKGDMMPSLEFVFKIEKALKITDGELSNLVIESARSAVGITGSFKQPEIKQAPRSLPSIEALNLSQSCPSCGSHVNLKLNFNLS